MALTGVLGADFSKFLKATADAETALKKMAGTGTDAAKDLSQLGDEAPKKIQAIGDESDKAKKKQEDWSGVVKGLAKDFAAFFTVGAALNFVNDVVADAAALSTLSQQTRINVEDLQHMAGAMSEFGVDANELGSALFKLSRGIAGGDESVANGLHLMGLSLKEVQGLQGEQLFLKITDGLASLQGGLRDTAAAELFGTKLGAAMSGAATDIRKTLAAQKEFNTAMTTESVGALNQYNTELERAQRNLGAMVGNALGPLAQEFNVLVEANKQGVSAFELFSAGLVDSVANVFGMNDGISELTRLFDRNNQKLDENKKVNEGAAGAQRTAAAAVDTRTDAEKFLAGVIADANITITKAQREQLELLDRQGLLNEKTGVAILGNAAAYTKYQKDATAALEAVSKTVRDTIKITEDWQHIDDAFHKQSIAHARERQTASVKSAQAVNDAIQRELEAQIKLNQAQGLDAQGAALGTTTAYSTLQQALDRLHGTQQAGISIRAQEQVLQDAFTKALYDEAVAQDAATAAQVRANEETKAAIELKAQAAAAAQTYSVSSPFSVGAGGDMNAQARARGGVVAYDDYNNPYIHIPGVNAPGRRAEGGPVSAGQPYVVGERGPELFIPATSGSIAANGAAGLSVTNHVYVTQPLGTPDVIARAVGDAVMRGLRTGGARVPI